MGFLLESFIIVSSICGLLWAYYNYSQLLKIPVGGSVGKMHDVEQGLIADRAMGVMEIGELIKEGASEFIWSEYKICSLFIALMSVVIFFCVDGGDKLYTTVAFITGAITSMFCGGFGMKIATFANCRTTITAKSSLGYAFKTAFRAGCVMGFTLVSVSMLVLLVLIMVYKSMLDIKDSVPQDDERYYQYIMEAIAGYGLGGSTIALFARVGGGIFTKAADLGADLVGKIQSGLPEDSPRNPATIADNVGDNVGDVAGMGADLFGSFAEATCAALVIGATSVKTFEGNFVFNQFLFVLAIPAIGMFVCLGISAIITEGAEITEAIQVEGYLKNQLIYSTFGLLPCLWLLASISFDDFYFIPNHGPQILRTPFDIFGCIAIGLVAGLIIGYVTEIMTSYQYKPVQELTVACKTGPATNIIYGLALGYMSTIIPVIMLCIVVYYSHSTLGFYGVALSALGMLSNLPTCLAIDGYGPIADNAGGIAEMAELPEEVRQRTDILDAAGNTTAAVGKGFAIGSATLVGFALYGAFMHSSYIYAAEKGDTSNMAMSFDDPMIFTSLLFGAMLPYAFSGLTMKSVGLAALGMIGEVRRQIKDNPGILNGTSTPDYKACVRISTIASLKEMILPGLLVTVTPFALGFIWGPKALLGFLPGAIVSGVQMAVSASNTGGAWDNCKKFIEAGLMKDGDIVVKKHSDIHTAAVIGDTVGDPLKDTSGPSLNILIKLMAILSLVFCKYFSR